MFVSTVLVYAPGLYGPFLFDDIPNLRPLADWLDGRTIWQDALLGNRSGLFGRPLSMLTFVANAVLFGMSPFWFKLGNLAIHLICGSLIYALMQRLLRRDLRLHGHASAIALAISAVWLLHPMQVSTVLYVVQRMAQLSALFMLFALLAYVHGRIAIEQRCTRRGMAWLFLVVPAAGIAAVLCKENGALTPLLCAVLELGYFRSTEQTPKPRAVILFFLFGLILPAVAAIAWCALHPESLLSGYEGRTFTLVERLLSQPRALADYIGALLLPQGPSLGLYTDDFVVSHNLWQPPSTLIALVGLATLIGAAMVARKRAPAIFTGLAFYLAGHAMESSVFPLELYFEHRNYLPSVGFFLATIGGFALVVQGLLASTTGVSLRLVATGFLSICITLAVATSARAWVWQSWTTIVEQGVRQHPESVRAQLDMATVLWRGGKIEQTRELFDRLSRSNNPLARHMAFLNTLKLQCQEYGIADPASIKQVAAIAGNKLQLAEMQGFEALGGLIREPDTHCDGLSRSKLADILVQVADAAPQPPSQTPVWRTRFVAADLYRRDNRNQEAITQAALAWMTGRADTAVGVVLANLYYLNGDSVSARLVLADVVQKMAPWDIRNRQLVAKLQAAMEAPLETPPEPAPSPNLQQPST